MGGVALTHESTLVHSDVEVLQDVVLVSHPTGVHASVAADNAARIKLHLPGVQCDEVNSDGASGRRDTKLHPIAVDKRSHVGARHLGAGGTEDPEGGGGADQSVVGQRPGTGAALPGVRPHTCHGGDHMTT